MRRQGPGLPIPAEAPWQSQSGSECKYPCIGHDCRAVGKLADLVLLQRWLLAGDGVPFGVQQAVDLRRRCSGKTVAPGEEPLEISRSVAPAIEAGPVARSQRRHLVEEEEFGPACSPGRTVAPHRLPPRSVRVFQCADDPRFGRPPSRKKRLRRWIVNDAAIACEETPRRRRDDLTGGVDPVLQWHKQPPFPASRAPCYRSAQSSTPPEKKAGSFHARSCCPEFRGCEPWTGGDCARRSQCKRRDDPRRQG